MTECKTIKLYHRRLCAGYLDRLIEINVRQSDAMTTGAGIDQRFNPVRKVWSALKTSKGREMFFTTNMDKAVSHVFYIRYIDCLNSEKWICYSGEFYDIVDVENLDERNEWLAIYCNVRGSGSNEANYA